MELLGPTGQTHALKWEAASPGELVVALPSQTRPGAMTLRVSHYGARQPQELPLKLLSEASRLDGFVVHAGDEAGTLSGARLDQVAELRVGELRFTPGALTRDGDSDRLRLSAEAPVAMAPGTPSGHVTMRDGRTAKVRVTIAPRRPSAVVLSRNVEARAPASLTLPDTLLPAGGRLSFSIRLANGPISPDDAIEIATADGSATGKLTVASGDLQRLGTDVAVATIEPSTLLGTGTAGALRFRPVRGNIAGDWQPLVHVVRLPGIEAVTCPPEGLECTLNGSSLFVVAALAGNAEFAGAISVPEGFVGNSLAFPRPDGETLYLKLHDAPDAPVQLALP